MNEKTPIENLSYDAKRALLEAGEQMPPELILEAPGAAASENVESAQEQVPESVEKKEIFFDINGHKFSSFQSVNVIRDNGTTENDWSILWLNKGSVKVFRDLRKVGGEYLTKDIPTEEFLACNGIADSKETEVAPEIILESKSKPNIKTEILGWYGNQDKPIKTGITEIFMGTEQPDAMEENKLSKLKNRIGIINGAGALAELTGFRGTETSEQNPVPDFNKFSRGGFKPVETAELVVETPLTVLAEEPKIETPVSAEEKIISDPSTVIGEVVEGDSRQEIIKKVIEKN